MIEIKQWAICYQWSYGPDSDVLVDALKEDELFGMDETRP